MLKLDRHLRNVSRQVINASRQAMNIAKTEGKDAVVKESIKELGVDSETSKDILDVKATQGTDIEKEALEESAA
ncbi:hypothetical protein [Vibrio marisflavi]|uniref:Uncharacterized protein n=1 Tax=Vibrio marisflavi CECT 7928 TaxID=634439 RepID=A0ABN8E955_9VIBR|nr:hypothetical protein [Vibrio marisflavi]CAH0543187.1 hypothetical protein VMF7928_04452 [Vibrio marisflavi CECT 7928]